MKENQQKQRSFLTIFGISLLIISTCAFLALIFSAPNQASILTQKVIINGQNNLQNEELEIQNDDLLNKLYTKLKKTQYSGIDLLWWKNQKGLFSSQIKMYVVSEDELLTKFGQQGYVPDNNMFVTSFVSYALIKMQQFQTIDVDEKIIDKAIDAILTFQNKNVPSDIPIYTFWPQYLAPDNLYYCWPPNMTVAINLLNNLPENIANWLEQNLGLSASFIQSFSAAFKIPADNDDTGINVALTSLLRNSQDSFPKAWQNWSENNQNHIKLYQDYVTKYTYRPFNSDYNQNTIDPRTYFYIVDFLDKRVQQAKKKNQSPSLILFGTWLTNIEEEVWGVFEMPMDVNNIDVTVNTNALFGLLSFLMENDEDIDEVIQFYDSEIQQLITDVTDLIVWAIESRIILERPDLSLTYYPNEFSFYWFVARIGNYLNSFEYIQYPEIQTTKSKINKLLETTVTQQLIELADGENQWSSFLGNFPLGEHNSDRAFSTAMALNALLDSWTIQGDSQQQLIFKNGIPTNVKELILNSYNNLYNMMSDDNTSVANAFFSGSVKSVADLPFWYPMNESYIQIKLKSDPSKQFKVNIDPKTKINKNPVSEKEEISQILEKLNKVKSILDIHELDYETMEKIAQNYENLSTNEIDPNKILDLIMYRYQNYVSGYVDGETYNYYANNYKWNGYQTPEKFPGYNKENTYFPYWSCPPMTYAYTMLAISKVQILE